MVEGYQEFAHKIHLYSEKGIGAGSLATLSQSEFDSVAETPKGGFTGIQQTMLTPSNLCNEFYKRIELKNGERGGRDELEAIR
jgi:hypothetical protein